MCSSDLQEPESCAGLQFDRLFTGATPDAQHLGFELRGVLDQVGDAQEMFERRLELVSGMDRQLFATEKQAEQLTCLKQAAFAVLTWHDDGTLER